MRKASALALMLLAVASVAQAKKDCTDAPQDKWMSEADFRARVEAMGYTIRKFKQPGSCYEIYGTDKDGRNVEIYFNPVDASIVKKHVSKPKTAP
jgi:hypothetical protein